ncbi:MAG: PVC-type heme-binding CxxCH protein [Isosphaeraceae bacterium]
MKRDGLARRAIASGFVFLIATQAVAWVHAGDDARAAKAASVAKPYAPRIAPASDEARLAMRSFRVPHGLAVELFAAEPLLANPVAFCVDEKGVFYVAETFRHGAGVTDTRSHMNWLDADLACHTVADRVAMYRKYLGQAFERLDHEHERVRRIVDRDGDGRADSATVFADGFNDPAAGIGAGLLARQNDVWYACIPWLWKLRDTTGDGRADRRMLLHEGYGVHVGFLGHDLHGLRFGPDGKLYFSIGDRGFNVTAGDGRKLAVTDTGAVLRCNPDGSELEVFATGLRNPQELAFDMYGNLFTGDNNSDSGDRARWVYVVEGGDSGWRIGYQFIESPVSRGPWNEEKLWYPAFAGQAAYIVPPIANIADGPSGLTYNPGVSLLPQSYQNHFFLVDFRGSSSQSGIRSFALEPQGASFRLVDSQRFLWSVLATDADFGPDGALYLCDWVEGWEKPNKGRLYRVVDPTRRSDPRIREVKTLLADGMEKKSPESLAALLAHPDMRVRQEAQFELAARGAQGWITLARVAASSRESRLARIHAIWGIGQITHAKRNVRVPGVWETIGTLVADADPEIRAQTAKIFGEAKEPKAFDSLIGLLADSSPRVRFFAAISLGKLGRPDAVGPLLSMLRGNADGDPYLRHAGVMGLAGSGNPAAWKQAAHDPSVAVRMGVLLTLRRSADPETAGFLDDPDPRVVLEAARAINDVPIAAALPRLAALAVAANMPLPLVRRVLNANFRLGGVENATRLAEVAGRLDLPESTRAMALVLLAQWAEPQGRDPVMGLWRPLSPRPPQPAADALLPKLALILSAAPRRARTEAAKAAAALNIKGAGPHLAVLATDRSQTDLTRATALGALDRLGDPGRIHAASQSLVLPGPRSRVEALRILAKVNPAAAIAPLQDRIEHGSAAERQGAIAILAAMPGDAARQLLSSWIDRLLAGKVAPEIQLDLLEAAGGRREPEFRRKLEDYEKSRARNDPLASYREAMAGGDSGRGMTVFIAKAEVACLRCHKIKPPAGEVMGGEVGPELSDVGARQNREYLLESIVSPDKQIAQGFESVVLATSDGKIHSGVLRGEDDREVRLITPEGQPMVVSKDAIEERKRGPSAMPADLVSKLSKTELRDLIEYLANLKAK